MRDRRPPRELRALQGSDAVVSVREACELLPWGRQPSEAYLRSAGLVRSAEVAGIHREWVHWSDVQEDLRRRASGMVQTLTRDPRKRVRLCMED